VTGSLPCPGEEIRVFRLCSRLNVGGPARHVIILAAGLRARGYSTRLVIGRESPREGNLLDVAAADGVICHQLDHLGREIHPLRDLRALWALYRQMRAQRPHIVHTHAAKAGVLGRVAARLAGVPVVVHTYHGHVLSGYFGRLRNAAFRRIEAALARWTSALVTVSAGVKQALVDLGVASAERIRVVPLGLDLDGLAGPLEKGSLRREAGFPADAPLVGLVGRLAPIKDVPTFLRAAGRVRERLPQARFSVVGDGEERARLEAQARELGLTDVLHFHGWRRDLAAVYGDLDVVVNCSRNEGTPVALIEALAAGRPVVATAVGGTPDLLEAGRYGRLAPAAAPDALAEAILETLAGGEGVRQRSRDARAHVLALHSSRRLVADIDALYRDLLAAPRVA
jgi:glycosyltransferase involved in cell wall biosynthesis